MQHPDDFGHAPLIDCLLKPPPPDLLDREDHACLEQQIHAISSLLSDHPGLLSLFHLYLAAALLQAPEPVFGKTRHFLIDHLDFAALLEFVPLPTPPGPWLSVPVVLTGAGRVYIRYFIVGKAASSASGNIMPSWAVPLFDPAALEAVQTAALAARALSGPEGPGGLFCFPLTRSATLSHPNRLIQFQGKSLGLPLALGFAAVLNQHPLPRNLAATGEITRQGEIFPVSHLDLKRTGLEAHRFTALIYPSAGAISRSPGPVICLPASTLGQAHMLTALYSPASTKKLMLLSACLDDPALLAKNIGILPGDWIEWVTRHCLIQPAMKVLLSDPLLFADCTAVFENNARNFDTGHARALQALVPAPDLDRLSQDTPLSVFRWCTAALASANHCGDTSGARRWEKKGLQLTRTISMADPKLVADFYNTALVARHNRYRFSPTLPPELARALTHLEDVYLQNCTFGCRTDPVLGRLYGTLMQHFAFCGPAYLDQTLTFFHKAVEALGRDQVTEYRQEWLRQYNYLTYALLDAGDWKGASQSLMTCFGCTRMDDLVEQICTPDNFFTVWQTALAARYFAEKDAHPAGERIFRHLLHRFQSTPGSTHPRQLTAFNLGRMALNLQDNTAGKDLLHQSIDLCFSSDAGPTIQVMALLPIAFLPESRTQKTWEQTIHSASVHLDPGHFSFLLDTPLDAARRRVRQTPAAWFPFNYR
jgi:hypothetical protein